MSNSRSKLAAIAECRCPRCREGKVFEKGPITFNGVGKVKQVCPSCHFKYEIETGFFWAAMYISYGINVAIMVAIAVAVRVLWQPSHVLYYLVPVVLGMLLAFPFTLRYSKILLLHYFASVGYEADWEKYAKG